MVRVDQAWGLFQLSVAAHDNHVAYYALGYRNRRRPSRRQVGLGCPGALSIKNIPTGAGDVINFQARLHRWCDPLQLPEPGCAAAIRCSAVPTGIAYQSIGFAGAPDRVFVTGSQHQHGQDLGFPRCLHPQLGSILEHRDLRCVRSGCSTATLAKALICGASCAGCATAGVTTCNPDFNIGTGGSHHPLDPGEEPDVLGGRRWTHLDQKYRRYGRPRLPRSLSAKPAAAYELKDQNTVTLLLRAQRNW